MCKYCENNEVWSNGDSTVYIERNLNTNNLWCETIFEGYVSTIIVPIEYCPFCGRKLSD